MIMMRYTDQDRWQKFNGIERTGRFRRADTVELCDGQLWENEKYVLKIEMLRPVEDREEDKQDMRAVMFVKTDKEGLRFLEFIWKDNKYISRLIEKMDLKLTQKKLIIQ